MTFITNFLTANVDQNKVHVEMRDLPCFCEQCSQRNYTGCTQKLTVGSWKSTAMTLKVIPKAFDVVPESIKGITKFYHGAILQEEETIIVGIMMKNNSDGLYHLNFGTLAVPPKINKKEALSQEHNIEKSVFTASVSKGAAFVRVKILAHCPTKVNCYYLNKNTKVANFSMTDIIGPTDSMLEDSTLNRRNFIKYSSTEITVKGGVQILYEIDKSCKEWLDAQLIILH